MPVGRNSWQDAKQKAKEKSNPKSSGFDKPHHMMDMDGTPDPRFSQPDRSSERMPTQDPIMRMTGGFPRATPRYSKGFPRPLKGDQDTLPGFLQEKILAADEPSEKNTENNPVKRHMKFCGGGSKPYKKK